MTSKPPSTFLEHTHLFDQHELDEKLADVFCKLWRQTDLNPKNISDDFKKEVTRLLQAGADPNLQVAAAPAHPTYKWSILHLAIVAMDKDLVATLIENGANPKEAINIWSVVFSQIYPIQTGEPFTSPTWPQQVKEWGAYLWSVCPLETSYSKQKALLYFLDCANDNSGYLLDVFWEHGTKASWVVSHNSFAKSKTNNPILCEKVRMRANHEQLTAHTQDAAISKPPKPPKIM